MAGPGKRRKVLATGSKHRGDTGGEEFVDEAFVAAGARRIQDYCLTMLDIIKCFF